MTFPKYPYWKDFIPVAIAIILMCVVTLIFENL